MDKLSYYWPELQQALKETAVMLGIAGSLGLIGGLLFGLLLYLYRPGSRQAKPLLTGLLTSAVNIIRSFPFLLLVIALIPVTRRLLGTAFGPLAAAVPLTIVAVAIYARLVEQVLLDLPAEVAVLADVLGAKQWQFVWEFILVEARSGLILSGASMLISLVSYSTVMGIVGGGGIGDFAIRYGYQNYEYAVMYGAVLLMILGVFMIQSSSSLLAKKLDKRK